MGGRGSGEWYRWNRKTTAEEALRLDVRYLRKRGWINSPGTTGSLSWSCGGEPSGWIRFRVEQDRLVLMYKYRSHGSDWQDYEEEVLLERTACNYGGERTWFLCPHCGKRVAVLYCAEHKFLCRHCQGLSYSSQNETYLERMNRKARKIRRRLGASDNLFEPIQEKPKGMHWKTFERLLKHEQDANDASSSAVLEKLRVLDGIDGFYH